MEFATDFGMDEFDGLRNGSVGEMRSEMAPFQIDLLRNYSVLKQFFVS